MFVDLRKENNIAYIEFDQPDSKVNVLLKETLARLDELVDQVKDDADLKAVVIQSKKKDCFLAGADINEIQNIVDPDVGAEKAKFGQDLFNKIEDLKIPSIVVIDGVALGGGCELALSCLYRVATFNPKVKIGCPEVNLGFVPGFGGTYRFPRVLGLSEGLKMILTGKSVDGAKALKIGLVDKLLPQNGLSEHLNVYLQKIISGEIKKPRRYYQRHARGIVGMMEKFRPLHNVIYKESRKNVLKLTKGFYPAPLKAIDVVSKGFYMKRQAALDLEAKTFGELAVTDVSKNCVKVFFLSENFKKLSLPDAKDLSTQSVSKVGVLGAGVMGGGIAQLLSFNDIWVRLKDINHEAVALGLHSANDIYQKGVKRRKMTKAQAQMKMAHITGTLDYSGFGNTDIVIEAVVENLDVKKKVFAELSENVSPETILASNTSALSVTEMGQAIKDPSKMIGFHFFNPVHRMPLIEVITTEATSAETIQSSLNLAKRLRKIPILVKDSPGFLVNRVLLVYMAEAGRLLSATGDIERIDHVMTKFGMPMGPFLLSDEVGLDVGLKVMHILEDAFGERYHPAEFFEGFLKEKSLGKKTGKGFYVHGKKRSVNEDISKWFVGTQPKAMDDEEMLRRMVYIMVNEAARCLEEAIVDGPETIDAGMIFGTGFPAFHGGLLRYADTVGLKNIVEQLDGFAKMSGDGIYAPCAFLTNLAKKGSGFYSL